MGRKKVIKAEDEEPEMVPEHLQPKIEESELNHYIDAKEIKRKRGRPKKK